MNKTNTRLCINSSFIRHLNCLIEGNNNSIYLKNSWGKHVDVCCKGQNNKLYLKGEIRNCKIEIYGDGNSLSLCGVKYSDVRIIIRGDGCKLISGKDSTCGGGRFVLMGVSNAISIGDNCQFADNIEIWATDSHPIYIDDKIINTSKPIYIGTHVWLGAYAKVLKGVSIGDNAIIGMNSVVTKSIESNTLNVGCPTKVIARNVNWDRNFIKE